MSPACVSTGGGVWHVGASRSEGSAATHLVFCELGDPWPHTQHAFADCGAALDWTVVTVENLCPECVAVNVAAGRLVIT